LKRQGRSKRKGKLCVTLQIATGHQQNYKGEKEAIADQRKGKGCRWNQRKKEQKCERQGGGKKYLTTKPKTTLRKRLAHEAKVSGSCILKGQKKQQNTRREKIGRRKTERTWGGSKQRGRSKRSSAHPAIVRPRREKARRRQKKTCINCAGPDPTGGSENLKAVGKRRRPKRKPVGRGRLEREGSKKKLFCNFWPNDPQKVP